MASIWKKEISWTPGHTHEIPVEVKDLQLFARKLVFKKLYQTKQLEGPPQSEIEQEVLHNLESLLEEQNPLTKGKVQPPTLCCMQSHHTPDIWSTTYRSANFWDWGGYVRKMNTLSLRRSNYISVFKREDTPLCASRGLIIVRETSQGKIWWNQNLR